MHSPSAIEMPRHALIGWIQISASFMPGEYLGATVPAVTLGRCLVTGGGGYLGGRLAAALRERGAEVRLLDLYVESPPDGAEVVHGDIRDAELVRKACEGIDTVFHCAAVINTLTRARASVRDRVFGINVEGTRNVVEACRTSGVQRLVYTSSISVVVDRSPCANVNEDAPYATTEPLDLYTASKIEAEKLVLAANGDGVETCALRPGGIYGPDELHHLPRLVREVLSGRFVAIVGSGLAKADNVYIDDLVDVHLRAADRLVAGSPTCGRAYQVGDGSPINYFEFFRPAVEALGAKFPRMKVPIGIMHVASWLAEWIHLLGGPFPFMTRMEVRKLDMDNYSDVSAAKRDLGWTPTIDAREGMKRSIPYVKRLASMIPVVRRPHVGWWIAVLGGLGLLFALAFSGSAYAWWRGTLGPMFPREVLQAIAAGAIALHVGEGIYAWHRARGAGLPTAGGWFRQTLTLGYPSLRLLLADLKKDRETT